MADDVILIKAVVIAHCVGRALEEYQADYSRSRLLDPVSNRCFAVLYFCAGISVALRRPETCRDG